jgi:CDP-glycerol glycerophosphotransferase
MHGIRNPWRFLWRGLLLPLVVGWGLLVPLALLIPKRRGLILFIGFPGLFADNGKYLFLHASRQPDGMTPMFLAVSDAQFDLLVAAGLPVVRAGSLKAVWLQLRARVVIVDTLSWLRPLRFHVLFRARRVQLWHGCPLKRIERDDHHVFGSGVPWPLRTMHALSGRFATLDLLLSPSPMFTSVAFANAFRSREIVEDDYPRNEVFERDDPSHRLGIDECAARRIAEARKAGLRIVLYMPTFRDAGGDAVSERVLDLAALQDHAHANRLMYVFKLHPVDSARIELSGYENLLGYRSDCDVYPLLKDVDLLVTDYSSVFFDFLHADLPIVFFAYDVARYTARDRGFYFDYGEVAPGPVVTTQSELERKVLEQMADGGAAWAERRRELLNRSFRRHDGRSSERLWQRIREMAA